MRTSITEKNVSFYIFEGELFEVANEDGLGMYPISWVIASVDDIEYIYPKDFLAHFVDFDDEVIFLNSKSLCNKFIENIKDHGSINLEKWELFNESECDQIAC